MKVQTVSNSKGQPTFHFRYSRKYFLYTYLELTQVMSDLRIISLYVTLRLLQEKSHVCESASTKGFEKNVIQSVYRIQVV